MGGKNTQYIKTKEDKIESSIKKGDNLRSLLSNVMNIENEIFNIMFLPVENKINLEQMECISSLLLVWK